MASSTSPLKDAFQTMDDAILDGINPSSITDHLLAKNAITRDDYNDLLQLQDPTDRCRELLAKLDRSSHPQAFIHLRLALLDDSPSLVDTLDEIMTSRSSEFQQLLVEKSSGDDEITRFLPTTSVKNELLEALEGRCFERASDIIRSSREADLVECYRDPQHSFPSYKTCIHCLAETVPGEQTSKPLTEIMEKIKNPLNRQLLLNVRRVMEFHNDDGSVIPGRAAAIHLAAYHGNAEVVRLLCQAGVDVNCSSCETRETIPRRGYTPILLAAEYGRLRTVRTLLELEADVNKKQQTQSDTALYAAAYNGHTEVVKLLLANNADVNARRTDDGATPLHVAAYRGHADVVKLLVYYKADVNLKTK